MLFYNWLSGYGEKWENNKNQFFTKWKMIYNLWYNDLYDSDFVKKQISMLKEKYEKLKREDKLFEVDE